ADAADAVPPLRSDDEVRVGFLPTDGAFTATIAAAMSDAAAAYRGNANGELRRNMEASFNRAHNAATSYSAALRASVISRQTADANPSTPRTLLPPLITAIDDLWQQAGAQLDGLLQERIDRLYRRMAVDLGTAVAVWLAALGLLLIIGRQITRPIGELAAVA